MPTLLYLLLITFGVAIESRIPPVFGVHPDFALGILVAGAAVVSWKTRITGIALSLLLLSFRSGTPLESALLILLPLLFGVMRERFAYVPVIGAGIAPILFYGILSPGTLLMPQIIFLVFSAGIAGGIAVMILEGAEHEAEGRIRMMVR